MATQPPPGYMDAPMGGYIPIGSDPNQYSRAVPVSGATPVPYAQNLTRSPFATGTPQNMPQNMPYVPQNAYNNFNNLFRYTGQQPQNIPASTGGQNLVGAQPFGYTDYAGGVPQVPNPITSALQAILGNLGNLGNLGGLSSGIGGINAGLGKQPYTANLPGYQGLLNQASANAQSNLQGNVPGDVIRNLQQAGAERGTAIGAAGSPNANSAYLRALGLTSLGLQNQGQQQFGQLVGMTPTGPSFNPSSMLIDPNMLQQAQAAANLYNSAPIPAAAQRAGFNALNQGLNRGQGSFGGGYTQPGSIQDILQKYAPFQGGTPSYGNLPQGYKANPNAVATTYSGDDSADLLNEFFGEGQYAQPQTDFGPYDTGYTGNENPFPGFLPPGEEDWYNF